ncbi:MAG: hypothetical protein K0Q48_2919 [Bacillota bacterium]|jgi:hypothetical protein|nr:hypothetical protein [Bacillota bacterium]
MMENIMLRIRFLCDMVTERNRFFLYNRDTEYDFQILLSFFENSIKNPEY